MQHVLLQLISTCCQRYSFLNQVYAIQFVCHGGHSGELRLYGEQHRSAEL